ncbi:MAG: MG2 domain-containing protein [Ginsengibacter sp.]
MRKNIFLLLAILILGLEGFSQANPGFDITGNLQSFFSSHSFENAYLQFDKPYYAAGDTIYFKAYVTEGEQHKLSELSGVLHVDLINPGNKIDQSIKLRLNSGISWGDFALPESLPEGNYRIRAYTQLMRNNGDADFFERTFPVGSLFNDKKDKKHNEQKLQEINQKPDIQFFPEGGNLVNGLRSKVAFKAIDENGLGIKVKGIILDNKNNIVDSLSSIHLGMGDFYLNPQEGNSYKAKLTFADGAQDTVDLPKSATSGIALIINNDSIAKASVKIEANANYYQAHQNKEFLLVIYSGGIMVSVNCKLDSSIIDLGILKKHLHTGVTRITLFSPDREPLCERLIFIKNKRPLDLHIKSDKTIYTKREKVNMDLIEKNTDDSMVPGHFSVSVVDENKVPENENNERNILTDLLLTSEVKGNVEQPNYYFNDTSEVARENLDVLMLTQGYRRFEWKQVMNTNETPLAFQPEKTLEISGKVTSISGKPLAKATVNLIPSFKSNFLTTKSGKNGLFHFSNLIFFDTTHFVLSAINAKGRNSTKISYLNNEEEPAVIDNKKIYEPIANDSSMSVYVENAKKVQEEYSHFKGKLLKPVILKGKLPLDNQYRTQSLAGAGNADQVMHAKEIERIGGMLSTSLNGRLRGIVFYDGAPYLAGTLTTGPMIVVIDGVVANSQNASGQVGVFDVNTIPSFQVETVEVLKSATASIYGMGGGNGVLIITTKQGGDDLNDIPSIGVLPIAPMGFYKAREFYAPKYDDTNEDSNHPDLRSTIYWNPEIKTSKDGNSSFNYYNADGTGTYKVTVEGIDDNGDIGRVVYRYKVE